MTESNLKRLISKAPTGPGIYIFTGLSKKLYIGKASNIRTRLSSYLKTTDQRILQMLSRASGIKTLETGSEIEALILESQYIKKYKPAFNIMLRDDKQFFYAVFTSEKFPKIFLTHQPNSKYRNVEMPHFVGPFTDGAALKTTLRYLRRIFPYCTCKKPHNNFCLNYHIGKCIGFCCLKEASLKLRAESLRLYQTNIKAIKDMLSGKKASLLKDLEKEMVALGKKGRFIKAIELRDKIEKIKRVFENARIIQNLPRYDISKNHKKILLDLKKSFRLKDVPTRIEGYDVSNIQGAHAIGAMVVFVNGKPDKDEYRKFKIKNTLSLGDTGMLKEILTRRLNHPEWPFPNLVLIDGGKGQLNLALKTIDNLQLTVNERPAVMALTKNKKHKGENIYIAREAKPIPLSQLPVSVKNLLLNIDSEAHRFAISYYRKLHRKNLQQKAP